MIKKLIRDFLIEVAITGPLRIKNLEISGVL